MAVDRMAAYEALVAEYRARTVVIKRPMVDVMMCFLGGVILVAPLISWIALFFTLGTIFYFVGVCLFLALRNFPRPFFSPPPLSYGV